MRIHIEFLVILLMTPGQKYRHTDKKAVHWRRKLMKTARAAYREKFFTAGMEERAPREKATVSQHPDNNILGPILPNTIEIWEQR